MNFFFYSLLQNFLIQSQKIDVDYEISRIFFTFFENKKLTNDECGDTYLGFFGTCVRYTFPVKIIFGWFFFEHFNNKHPAN